MAEYDDVFRYTSSTDGSFAVKPHSANGPMSPASTVPYSGSSTSAVSINTPFVLVGKGVAEYGQLVQNNIIYLAENFCNKTRPIPPLVGMLWFKPVDFSDPNFPTDPTAKGMYLWDGTAWTAVMVNGQLSGNVDVSNQRVINVGDAISATDALSMRSADTRYLQLTGGSISGDMLITSTGSLKIVNPPTVAADVATKGYVDDVAYALQNGIDIGSGGISEQLDAINDQLPTFYKNTGGTISGNVTIGGNLSVAGSGSVIIEPGIGLVDFGGKQIQNIGAPILAFDAAHKTYVDETIAAAIADLSLTGGGAADGVVSNGSLDDTGVLTLTRTEGLPPVVVNGLFAVQDHSHDSTEIPFDPRVNLRQSVFNTAGALVGNVSDALVSIDRQLSYIRQDPVRTVIKQTVLDNTTFIFPGQQEYAVWSDRLMVYVNGIKKYANTRSETGIQVSGVSVQSVIGIPEATYTQDLIINGTTHTMSVDITTTTTYLDLLVAIQTELTDNSIPAHCIIEQSAGDILFTFASDTSGTGFAMSLATTVGQLFPTIPGTVAVLDEIGETYDYEEIGLPGDDSVEIEFAVAPPLNSLIEVTVIR